MIEVRLFATFRINREKILFLSPEEYPNTRTILEHLQIPVEEVAILLINGLHSKPDDPLKEGDVVALFPPVGGG